jgi:hypothetical protein
MAKTWLVCKPHHAGPAQSGAAALEQHHVLYAVVVCTCKTLDGAQPASELLRMQHSKQR